MPPILPKPLHPMARKFRIEFHSTEIQHFKKVDVSDMDFCQVPRSA
jgi:hypothetical protein